MKIIKKRIGKKASAEDDMFFWAVAGVILLFILIVAIGIIFGKGSDAIAYIERLLRGG